MLRNFFMCLFFIIVLSGCGDEGVVNRTLPLADENVPAAPSWTPDAITIAELIYPYAAKHAVGIHDIAGEEFSLAVCEVLYRSRWVRRSERDNRWVRLSTGDSPSHATNWTHNGIPQSLYIFLNFESEADFQQFGIGIHENVPFSVVGTHQLRANTWELTLMYKSRNAPLTLDVPRISSTPGGGTNADASAFVATAETGYFWSGRMRLDGFTLTSIAYDASGLTLRSANGFASTPGRLVLTQSATGERNFGRRITFTASNIHYNGDYAYIWHANLSQEQSKDLRLIGEDIKRGDIFHLYVYQQ